MPLNMMPVLVTKDMANNYDIDIIMTTVETKEVVGSVTFMQRYR